MDLLIDGQALQGEGKRRGIGRYSRELLDAIVRVRPDWRLRAVASDHLGEIAVPESVEVLRYAPPAPFHPCDGPTTDLLRLHYADWLRARDADAILVLSAFEGGGIPIQFLDDHPPTVAVFYDLIPLLFAESYLHGQPAIMKYFSRQLRSTATFDGLLAISETSRDDLVSLLGYRGEVVNIQGAPASDFRPEPRDRAERRLDRLGWKKRIPALNANRYLLYVGGGDFRKNLPALFTALAKLPESVRRAHPLVIAGELPKPFRDEFDRRLAALGIADSVIFLGYVDDRELLALYQCARLFVFPSMYEGLGLPVLEAMACGTDVVASGTSSIPEFSGPGVAFFDPANPDSIAHAVYDALAKPARASADAARAFADGFTWDRTGEAACRLIEKLVARPKRQCAPGRVVWSRPFDAHTTEDDLAELCTAFASLGPDRLALAVLPEDAPPAPLTARLPCLSFDELDRFLELHPASAFVYECDTPERFATLAPQVLRRPGVLVLDRALAESPALDAPHLRTALLAADRVLIRGLRTGEAPPARFKHLKQSVLPVSEFAAALAEVEEIGSQSVRRWRNAAVAALLQAPLADPLLGDWVRLRATSADTPRWPAPQLLNREGRTVTSVPQRLLDLVVRGGPQLWIGAHPPFDMDSLLLYGCTNFRAPAELHGKFDVVWCYESPISELGADQHLLAMDELVRFVGERGMLVLRYKMHDGGLAIKNILGRRPGLKARVLHEETDAGGHLVSIVELERTDMALRRPAPWTFGILTQNTRKANVVAMLKSIRDCDPAGEHEILICGPEAPEYAFAKPRYLPQNYSPTLPEICRKKNDIARAASHPNLLLAHDRYRLDEGFFSGFDQYGYDFDFLAIAQYFENGDEYPAYCHMADDSLRMTPPSAAQNLNALRGTSFINGGLMVFKTHILRAIPLNELCFWNQAEDVEITVTYMRHGIAPRFNPYASATTIGVDKSHIRAFVPAGPPPAVPCAPIVPASMDRPRRSRRLLNRLLPAKWLALFGS